MVKMPTGVRKLATASVAAAAFGFVAACGPSAEGVSDNRAEGGQNGSGGAEEAGGFPTSVLATDLKVPRSFACLPGGDAFVTERDSGRLLRVSPLGGAREVQTLPEDGSGKGGLLGVAVSPDYERDGYGYGYTTTQTDRRVHRARSVTNTAALPPAGPKPSPVSARPAGGGPIGTASSPPRGPTPQNRAPSPRNPAAVD